MAARTCQDFLAHLHLAYVLAALERHNVAVDVGHGYAGEVVLVLIYILGGLNLRKVKLNVRVGERYVGVTLTGSLAYLIVEDCVDHKPLMHGRVASS